MRCATGCRAVYQLLEGGGHVSLQWEVIIPKKGDLLRECAKGSLIKLPAGDGKVCVNSRYYIGGKHRLWSQS